MMKININNNKKKITVLCGGAESNQERGVSLRSGAAVCSALIEAGFDAEIIDLKSLDELEQKILGKDFKFDKAFITMHGEWGEGGELQAKLDALNMPYTGSEPKASELAMDKWASRELFKQGGIKIPKGLLFAHKTADFERVIAELGADIVVKPRAGGSTVGTSIIKDLKLESFNSAVNLAHESYLGDVLIEEYIPGRELTVGVWERDGKAEALPVIEIAPKHGFYDYENKYTAGSTEYIVPAVLDADIALSIADAAVKAHEVLGCRDYSRADFRLAPDGEFYILEVNTAPGMTATSLVPKAAKAAGFSMSEFVKIILNI
ncbi:MAG: D-alanine--D-alanine ligase [Synergistaceae bacterium]|nr:D-alanine--D-alanine ligase [Synergistaceae bacterium]